MKSMQSIIDYHFYFELNTKNKPIYLLEEIRNMMHKTVRVQYTLVLMIDDLNQFTRKIVTEFLLDYVARFKQNRDIIWKST